jgi:2-oxoglutarate ferredoxin oxidoreductase subunit gamma
VKLNIRITGSGGQGAITAGHILGSAAVLYDKKEAVVTEGYSPYVTGGWSRADIVLSDEPIDYPMVSKLDALMTMFQEGLDSNLGLLKKDSVVVVEKKLVDVSKVKERSVVVIPAIDVAESLGRKVVANIVLLGSLAGVFPIISIESLKTAVSNRFPKAAVLNVKALEAGYDLAQRTLKTQGGIPA